LILGQKPCFLGPIQFVTQKVNIHYNNKRRSRASKVAKKEPIKCKVCSREFERQATLFNHMATAHSEERNFACSYCDFKAKISVVLKRWFSVTRFDYNGA